MAFITIAGENKIALQQGNAQVLNVSHFVLANIAGLGTEPADRIESLPAAGNIVDTRSITKSGYVNNNQVVYSLTLDSTIGDYTFNWIGLKDIDNVLIAVIYLTTPIVKTATAGGIDGNNLVRNFLLQYSGIQATTAISAPASTWQIDFTTRLLQIDERERSSNLDIYGHEAFFDGSMLVSLSSGTLYNVAAGVAYIGGVRCKFSSTQQIDAAPIPTSIWMDASLQGDLSGVVEVIALSATSAVLTDFTDGNGFQHYLTKIADISSGGVVTDTRVKRGHFLRSDVDDTMAGALTVKNTTYDEYLITDTDITALVPGSGFGSIIKGKPAGHVVIGIVGNDGSDSFSVLADENLDGLFTKNLFTVRIDGTIETDGNKIWHAGNHGSGSGLDADLLDGQNSALTAAGNTVAGRDAAGDITARLFISEYDITNPNIGFIMTQVNTGADAYIRPSTPAQVLAVLNVENGATADQTAIEILTSLLTVDGPGSGLNADYLDNLDSSQFLRSDVNDTITGSLTIKNTVYDEYSNTDTDITALVPGSVSGSLLRGKPAGHVVIGVVGNDGNDSFSVLADENLDGVFTKNLFTVRIDGTIETDGNKIWHAGNHGSGSGLDADLLDGQNRDLTATGNTVAGRNAAGDIAARLFISEYDITNPNIGFIMTQVNTGADAFIRPSTPAQVLSSLNIPTQGIVASLYATNGYVKYADGYIVQWGRTTITTESSVLVSFPIPFPTSCLNATAAVDMTTTNNTGISSAGVNIQSNSQIKISLETYNGHNSLGIYWEAKGY